MATAGFVVSLIGLLLSWTGYAIILSIIGIVLSVMGRRQAVERGASTGLATAGLVCGIIGAVIALLIIIFVIILVSEGDDIIDNLDITTTVNAVIGLRLLSGKVIAPFRRRRSLS